MTTQDLNADRLASILRAHLADVEWTIRLDGTGPYLRADIGPAILAIGYRRRRPVDDNHYLECSFAEVCTLHTEHPLVSLPVDDPDRLDSADELYAHLEDIATALADHAPDGLHSFAADVREAAQQIQ
jgi:hypothetical protein